MIAHRVTASDNVEIRKVQPYEARKLYWCPGCNGDIAVGLGHYVVVPLDDPEQRRHWHYACWDHRGSRRPGRVR